MDIRNKAVPECWVEAVERAGIDLHREHGKYRVLEGGSKHATYIYIYIFGRL